MSEKRYNGSEEIGDIYSVMWDVPIEDLVKIKDNGIKMGHAGVFFDSYLAMNLRGLIDAGANGDVSEFERAVGESDHDAQSTIMERNGLDLQVPSVKEVFKTLLKSRRKRGHSIEAEESSTGELYQKLFGKDFENFNFNAKTAEGDRVHLINYMELGTPEGNRKLAEYGFGFEEKNIRKLRENANREMLRKNSSELFKLIKQNS